MTSITNDGEVTNEVGVRFGTEGERAFEYVQSSILNWALVVQNKRGEYSAVVSSTLLYGSETWVGKIPSIGWLKRSHNHCIK